MKAVLNYKICDGVKDCGTIKACPKKAITYNEMEYKIEVDNRCNNCKKCVTACPIGAIKVPNNNEEYETLLKMVELDRRTIQDLFIDRYGAMPLDDFFLIDNDETIDLEKKDVVFLIELFNDDSIHCLLKSIPIKAITLNMIDKVMYYKLKPNDDFSKKYDVKVYPTLLIIKNKELLGKIEGYYGVEEIKEFGKLLFDIVPKKDKVDSK